jgi:hypothetical protein
MGYRRFTDRDGKMWEVRDRSTSEWELGPVSGNPRPAVRVRTPGYESDPFELSTEELQRLLDSAPSRGTGPRKSPFTD